VPTPSSTVTPISPGAGISADIGESLVVHRFQAD
jgi:hypothetical protein